MTLKCCLCSKRARIFIAYLPVCGGSHAKRKKEQT